jgi:uncharacterized protein (DUF305 family)
MKMVQVSDKSARLPTRLTWQSLQEAVLAMEKSGDAGPDYARIMIAHSQGAIEMTEVLLKQPQVDPALKKLAEKVRAEQRRSMESIQRWLSANQTK